MPIVATSAVFSPLPGMGGREMGEGPGVRTPLAGATDATLSGTLSRVFIDSLSAPSIAYSFHIKLGDTWLPASAVLGPVEIDESIDTIAVLFSFTLVGRRWSVQSTETTWTSTTVEIWVTAGPIGATRTWRRAFGVVLTCEPQEGLEPTLRIKCGDPSTLYADIALCYEFPPSPAPRGRGQGRGTRGEICTQILEDAGLTSAIPAGALYRKPVITDSQRLWDFLHSFGEPELWSWRFTDWTNVEAYQALMRTPPEPPDDIWTLRDVVSIETTPPADAPSQWVIRSTQVVEEGSGLKITKTRTEEQGFYAIKKAVAQQLTDGTLQPLPLLPSEEVFRTITILEEETQEQAGRLVAKITRQWGWYNPRAAKLRTILDATEPQGPVEDGYHWAQAFLDDEGRYVAWRQESFVQTGERRERPIYDAEGTEIGRHIETFRWHSRPMATRSVGSAVPNVIGAAIGDDDRSWYPFEKALTALLRIESFGLAQVDHITTDYGDTGAAVRETQETSIWYSARTAVQAVPWYVNYSGAGQKDLVAPFQRYTRKTTINRLTEDGLLAGTVEATTGWVAPKRVGGAYEWGDQKSNLQQETWGTAAVKTTTYNVLDESTYEELTDDGTGARPRLVMGRAPRPRYRASTWTTLRQAPLELILEDPVAEEWWGFSAEVLTLDHIQSLEEAIRVATRRRSRRMAFRHTVIRPICPTKPGDTIQLIDPRTNTLHRCLVARRTERWSLTPRPQILATYTLEQPL